MDPEFNEAALYAQLKVLQPCDIFRWTIRYIEFWDVILKHRISIIY